MKILLSYIFIFSFLLCKSQTLITYKFIPIEDKNSKVNELIKSISPNYESLCNLLSFELLLYNDASYFKLDKNTIPDDNGVKMIIGSSGYTGLVIQKTDSLFRQNNFDHYGKKYIVQDTIQKGWKLINETKQIMGYTCYKAEIQSKKKGMPNIVNTIYAWYCPQFPFEYGPVGFGKLPGLIFELQNNKAIFGITKIETKIDKIEIPEFDKKSEYITNEELEKTIMKLHGQRVELMKGDD